jgi:hypothetical protein
MNEICWTFYCVNDDKEVDKLEILKSWDVWFVTTILCMLLIQTQKNKKYFKHIIKHVWYDSFEKTCG